MKGAWKPGIFLAAVCPLAVQTEMSGSEQTQTQPPIISRVASMPEYPRPFDMRNWREVTRGYVDFVFDFDRRGQYLPLTRWLDESHNMVWMPAYVGNKDGPESINYLAAVLSGSLVGLDMRSFKGHDWVALETNFFSRQDGIFLDWPKGKSGDSFWYDVLPNVLFYQLAALYPSPTSDELASIVAEHWYRAAVALGGSTNPPALPDIDHTSFNFRTMQPFDNGSRAEPEGAAGVAWIEYMAWRKFKDPRFLLTADWMIRSLEQRPVKDNPLYEVLLPYAAFIATRMNAELGSNYDVPKLIDWCFDPRPAPQARPNWGVITGSWNGLDVDGLVGSVTDGGGYAFAMDTFQYVGALTPLVRYDARYAKPLGKWILNAANAARLFYPNALDSRHQSSHGWAATNDPNSVIAYEGLRRWKREANVAASDFRTVSGKIVQGSFVSTHYYRDNPSDEEVLEETPSNNGPFLEHLWAFDLPEVTNRFLVVAADRVNRGHSGNVFRFFYAVAPDGPFTEAFSVSGANSVQFKQLPDSVQGKLYLKVESRDGSPGQVACDRLAVDAMAISSCSDMGPYAQGDVRVSFVALLDNSSVPIVLYRPESEATDLGLYGSSHVGNLGGIIKPTNVEGILKVDILATDYFHDAAYPSYLYYNPRSENTNVWINAGGKAVDLYDAVSHSFVARGVSGDVSLNLARSSAEVIVLAPAGGKETQEGSKFLIDGVVVDFQKQKELPAHD